jgi:hypothetical protein
VNIVRYLSLQVLRLYYYTNTVRADCPGPRLAIQLVLETLAPAKWCNIRYDAVHSSKDHFMATVLENLKKDTRREVKIELTY